MKMIIPAGQDYKHSETPLKGFLGKEKYDSICIL